MQIYSPDIDKCALARLDYGEIMEWEQMFHCMRYFNNSELCSFARAAALAWADHRGCCGPAGANTAAHRPTNPGV